MKCMAVVLAEPGRMNIDELELSPPGERDVVVDIAWSGISTGTERLLWSGQMPAFPGMGYPLVPGYESVGRIVQVGAESGHEEGETVFVPGSQCFGAVKGLFGGAASRVVTAGSRVLKVNESLGEQSALLALAATAYHAIASGGYHPSKAAAGPVAPPDLIVGHGVLGRLLARITVACGAKPPVVWEHNPIRADGALGYSVIAPDADTRRDYRNIYDVSGDAKLINSLVGRLAFGGEIVLAGFYSDPVSFMFAPAFMREARFRVAAQWQPGDLVAVQQLIDAGLLSLSDLITHRSDARQAPAAYETAFTDPACLKMILDWSYCA
jgi:bacteriochlorophyllide a dehydrogenase